MTGFAPAHDGTGAEAEQVRSATVGGLQELREVAADRLRLERQLARTRAELQVALQARRALEAELVRLRSELQTDKTNRYAAGRYGDHANAFAAPSGQTNAVANMSDCPPN